MTQTASRRFLGVRGILIQVIAGLLVTGALVVLIEVGAGLLTEGKIEFDIGKGDYVDMALHGLEMAPDENPTPLIFDARLLWRNQPGGRKTQSLNPVPLDHPADWRIENNSMGFRGPELIAPGPAPDVFRVLCIGDSVTFGFNVDQGAPYPRQLEAPLRERIGGRRVEVINAAVAGWSWIQGRRFLEDEGLALKPDVVVMGHGTNDRFYPAKMTDVESFERVAAEARNPPMWFVPYFMHSKTYRALVNYVPSLRDRVTLSSGCEQQIKTSRQCRRLSLADIGESVRAVHQLTSAAGVDLVLLNLDFIQTNAVDGSKPAAAEVGARFVDMVDVFTALSQRSEHDRAAALGLRQADAGGTRAKHPAPVTLRVLVPEPVRVATVRGGAYVFGSFDFDERLYDDGTHGDEVAGDHVYTAQLEVPPGVGALEYRFERDGSPELVPLPPNPPTKSYRLLRLGAKTVGPVNVFGELSLMAERTHPNAAGHRVIAEYVLREIEQLESFKRASTKAGPSATGGAQAEPRG